MILNELIEKYFNDNDFKQKLLSDIKEKGLKVVIDEYNLPYSEEEVKEMVAEKIEATNCSSEVTLYSILTVTIGCVVSEIKDGRMTEECII